MMLVQHTIMTSDHDYGLGGPEQLPNDDPEKPSTYIQSSDVKEIPQ